MLASLLASPGEGAVRKIVDKLEDGIKLEKSCLGSRDAEVPIVGVDRNESDMWSHSPHCKATSEASYGAQATQG